MEILELSSAHAEHTASRTCFENHAGIRSYGICVKLQRQLSRHSTTKSAPARMENDCIQTDNGTTSPDSNLKSSHDTAGYSNNLESNPIDLTNDSTTTACCDCVTSSSEADSVDLYDQLVQHFTKQKSENKEVCNTRRRKRTASTSLPTRRRHTVDFDRISRGSSQSNRQPCGRAASNLVKRHSSTSSTSSRTFSNHTFSGFRSLSSSNSELENQHLTAVYCKISSDSLETRKSCSQESTDCCSNTDDSVSVLSSKSTSVLLVEYKSQIDPSTIEMLRSQVRRSMTPDLTTVHRRGRSDHNDYINSLLSPASSLDRVTADSIDRGKMKRIGTNKFNETIESVGQLSGSTNSLPQRPKSALGNYARENDDQWSANSANDRKAHTLSGAYSSRGISNASPTRKSPATAYALYNNGLVWSKSYSTDSSSRLSQHSDARTTSSRQVTDCFGYEVHARPNSALDVALSEDHDSIMRLLKMPEDDFTIKLISTMRELKDIAEVARIIDEVDDEEWLLMFIGELDHRLRYLMKQEEEVEEPQDHEANLREKATILDVALDLISFLKERSAYRTHRGRSELNMDQYFPSNENSPAADDGTTTIKRMRKLADAAPLNPYDMQKWQRQLMNLAGTLDKYITVLQKEKSYPTTSKTRSFNSSPRGYQKPSHGTSYSFQSDTTSQESDSSGRNFIYPTKGSNNFRSPDKNEKDIVMKTNYNHNSNNNNNVPHAIVTSQPSKTLPVLDLRDTQGGSQILSHISQAAQVSEPTSPPKSPQRSVKGGSPSKIQHTSQTDHGREPASLQKSPYRTVTGASPSKMHHTTQEAHLREPTSQHKSPHRSVKSVSPNSNAQQIEPNVPPYRGNKNAMHEKNRPSSSTYSRPNNDLAAYQTKSVDDLKKAFERGVASDDAKMHSRQFDIRSESQPSVSKNSQGALKRSVPTRSKSLRDNKPKRTNPTNHTLSTNKRREREQNPLACRSWVAGDESDASRKSSKNADSLLKANAVVSAYCILPEKPRKRSSSMTSESEREYRRQKSEFTMSVRDDEPDNTSRAIMRRSVSTDLPNSSKSVTPLPRSKDVTSSGARPKVRSSATIPAARRSKHDSSSSSDFERPRQPRVMTSSSSTQCDFDQGMRQREKNSKEMLNQMKRKADLLKSGLEEARRERDEKDRKIAVLQARLERTKKNLVVGESEKGAVEEEMDRLNKLLKEKTVESEEEISALKRRLQELEKKLERENRRFSNMNDTVENLQAALTSAERRVEKMEKNKEDLEQQIEELTTALVRERQNSAHIQQENARLEQEVETKEKALAEARKSRNKAGDELQRHNHELAEELERAKEFAKSVSEEKEKMDEKVREMQNDLQMADAKIASLETRKRDDIGKNSELEQDLNEARQHAEAIAKEKSILESTIGELEIRLESTSTMIDALKGEKLELQAKNQELAEALAHEQMMSKDLAECYMEQVEYLNKELKLNEEMKNAQQDQYDKEISRLLAESSLSSQQAEELEKAKEDAKREKSRADELEKENEKLRQQQEQMTDATTDVRDSGDGPSTEDKSVQADDMSYTRMRAFDWYSSEARQDAMRLTEQGRQLEMETRRRIARARDAMRAVNESIIKERRAVKMYTFSGAK